ncbi:antibiotic biosynthesis monooxygenase family protein [Staphylococcus lutrae]|uniref:Signal transduction protein TRAP n=1 Tax=Staphylococcus lutrae TaxID=155085 RepID=A0AAC9WMH9_9STAP|nr:antibiotic biosynthesis monooxygenase [Staphylococcus lutrae]ARJ50987.1 antibiotic biosynthesis monooxygenase [Staphylococcus lutrae]PNZ37126.1 antibiotic biosynthesis monooxygenase [Staphylococcus lutrae]
MLLAHKERLYQIEVNDATVTIYKNNDTKTYTTIETMGKLIPHHFCVLHYIKVDRAQSHHFETRFLGRTSYLNKTHGFIGLRALRPLNLENHYVIMTLWRSRRQFEVWQQSDNYLNIHDQCQETLNRDAINIRWSYQIKFDMA